MKLLFLLFIIGIVGIGVYFYSSKKWSHTKKKRKCNWRPLGITAIIVFLLLSLVGFGLYTSANTPDTQCTITHIVTSKPPLTVKSALDYFEEGNDMYDTGNCKKAISDYTNSLQLNANYPQAYNNRAYTYMRMRDYKDALADLDKAIQLNPNYIQALMNRGDIHNYYYAIDRSSAIADYEKVIALGGRRETSVCGHLMLARHNGWNVGTFIDYVGSAFKPCN